MGAFLRALHERQPLQGAVAHYQAQAAIAELQRLQGKGLVPQAGCLIAEMCLGDASVFVEYEYEPAQRGTFDDPPLPAQVNIIQVLVNGAMVDADKFADSVLDQWIDDILGSDQGDA
jgi:hypothetical protein